VKRILQRGGLAGLALVLGLAVLGLALQGRAALAQAIAGAARPASAALVQSGGASTPQPADQQEVDETAAYRQSPMVRKMGAMVGLIAGQADLAFEVTNFGLLAIAIGYALAKMLPQQIRDRNTAIQKHLVEARTATEEAGARLHSVEQRLGKLDGEIAAMRAQAEQDWARDEARIKAAVEDEKRKILAAAEQEIVAATSHAQKALQQYAAELAIEQAARKLVVTAETDRLLVQSFAERLTGGESKKGQN